MKDVLKVILVVVVIVLAWKIIKGLIGLAIGVALAGLIVWGSMKLLDNNRKRLD